MITSTVQSIRKVLNNRWSIEDEPGSSEINASIRNSEERYDYQFCFDDLDTLKSFVDVATEYIKIAKSVDRTTKTPTEPQWLGLTDAAAIMGVSDRTVRRWVKGGKLPSRIHKGLRYVKVDPLLFAEEVMP